MVILTATVPQYANGIFFLQAAGSNLSQIAGNLNTFGAFTAVILPNIQYGITVVPPAGSSYSRFGTTFLSENVATQDISAILNAAIPPPIATGGVLLNPTASQTVQQPTGTQFEVKNAANTSGFLVNDQQAEMIAPTSVIQANSQNYVAPAAGDTPGLMLFQANPTSASGSLIQFAGSVFLFEGINLENYIPATSNATIDANFGASVAVIDASAGDVTLTLPNNLALAGTTIPADGMMVAVIRNDVTPAGHTATVAPTSPSTIQGSSSLDLPDKTAVTLLFNASLGVWQIQTDNRPISDVTTTIPVPKLTDGGSAGSLTFTNGILVSQISAN